MKNISYTIMSESVAKFKQNSRKSKIKMRGDFNSSSMISFASIIDSAHRINFNYNTLKAIESSAFIEIRYFITLVLLDDQVFSVTC